MNGTETLYEQSKPSETEEWTEEQGKEAGKLEQDIIDCLRNSLIKLFRRAHEGTGVSAKEFMDGLFVGPQPILAKKEGVTPDNVYGKLDYQACIKYLYHGYKRKYKDHSGKEIFLKDSTKVLEFCGLKHSFQEINKCLASCIIIRNESAHQTEKKLSKETFEKDYQTLQTLTNLLFKDKNADLIASFWNDFDIEKNRILSSPIPLNDFCLEVFSSSEERPSKEQLEKVTEFLEESRYSLANGLIHKVDDKKKLLNNCRKQLDIVTDTNDSETNKIRLAEYTPAPPMDKPLWSTISPGYRALFREPTRIPLHEGMMDALLDSFTLLIDESIFASVEGRSMLERSLLPALIRRKQKLLLDESVVNTLFRQFRETVPYTRMELMEMELNEDEIQDYQDARQKEHKNLKAALKLIDLFRSRRCLTVISSLTDSQQSYWNIYHVAASYPQNRFLVLTMKKDLAEELKDIYGTNAVAMKVNVDGQSLMVFRATREVYNRMLNAASAGQDKMPTTVSAKNRTIFLVKRAAGNQLMKFGKKLGEGGEGDIYEVQGMPGMAAKFYYPDKRTRERQEKLEYMTANNPDIVRLCWPSEIIYTPEREFLGFLMPRASGKELAKTVFHPGNKCINITKEGWTRKSLALIAANVSAAFAALHDRGILMGDVNARNILVEPDCSVWLLDCDSYQINRWNCPVGTVLYTPPEVHKRMRSGSINYNFTRTKNNELYSLAVLLFQILMLGQSPYATVKGADVVEAIIAQEFPYKFRKDGEDVPVKSQRTRTPSGNWERIWSNTTYQVKEAFYNTFTGGRRCSTKEWESTMRNYARLIEEGKSSDELMNTSYKVIAKSEDDETSGTLVDQTCEFCGVHFNLDQNIVLNRQKYHDPVLCSVHWDIYQTGLKEYQGQYARIRCGQCQQLQTVDAAKLFKLWLKKKDYLCDTCYRKIRHKNRQSNSPWR